MYQRRCALERPASDLFGAFMTVKYDLSKPPKATLPELTQKPSFPSREPKETVAEFRHSGPMRSIEPGISRFPNVQLHI
jgi:hypothetical protein